MRKYAVEIEVQGTIITVSGFKDYVPGAVWDVKLLLEKIGTAVSDGEILRTVQWMRHDPASSMTPYSSNATVFIESAWRMKQEQVDILLDNQPHTINFEKMQEHNVTLGKYVKISRKRLDVIQRMMRCVRSNVEDFSLQVEKLMNRLLFNQYKLKKASVLQRATYPEVERTLYHGTNETSVKEICVHGFNRSFSTAYGQGVYFAVNSALSVLDQYSPPNINGHKFIFVSKVLTGDFTKGCHSMKTTPLKETGDVPLRYDSVTDHITKPTMFVIFNDTQAFPEYLITCQRILLNCACWQ
uniref:Poly [ADP-ribose] polymerase n=1 Tax=Scophthalmus maximus TaxID=52904 RepID=A0A8D3E2R0_SCOMX